MTNEHQTLGDKMPADIAEAAEGRIWSVLRVRGKLSVVDLAAVAKFTPQYTRKALRHLERATLVGTVARSDPTLWYALGASWEVIRFVKTRDAVASSRARRAKCIKLWRHLHRHGKSMTIAELAEKLGYDGATVQAVVRQLKIRGCILNAEIQPSGRSIALVAGGTQEEMREAIALPVVVAKEVEAPRFPRVNSVWALGGISLA